MRLSADISLHLGAWRTSAHGAFRQTFRSGTWRTSTPHGFNSTACDFEAFPAAFPNLQAHRLSSREWTPPLLSEVGHETMYRRALSQLAKFDVVGGTSQLDRWMQARAPALFTSCPISFPAIADAHDVAVQLVCAVAGIAPCPALKQVDDAKRGRLARDCIAPSAEAARGVMERHALADERLHTYAMARLDTDWQALRAGAARLPIQAPTPTGHTDAAALAAGRPTPCGLVLFLHLEKTGGSTMVKMFEELEKRNELLFFNQACGWPQFASQLMERFRSELGLPYGSNGRRRLDRLMRPDSWMALPPGGKCSSGPHIQRGPHFEPMPFAAPPAFHQLPGSARTPLIICILHF